MKRDPLWLAGVLAVFAVAFGQAMPGQAAMILGVQVTLAELIDSDEPAVVGDKEFSNFAYTPTGNAPLPEDITVTGIFDSTLQAWGLQFSGNFSTGFLEPKTLDAGLSFEVEATDPNYLISDVHLSGTVQVDGTGSAGIAEVVTSSGQGLGSLRILNQTLDGVAGPNNAVADEIVFAGVRKIRVTKDIRLRAGPGDFDTAEVTTFTQVFTQTQVPEPAGVLLICIATAAFGAVRRR